MSLQGLLVSLSLNDIICMILSRSYFKRKTNKCFKYWPIFYHYVKGQTYSIFFFPIFRNLHFWTFDRSHAIHMHISPLNIVACGYMSVYTFCLNDTTIIVNSMVSCCCIRVCIWEKTVWFCRRFTTLYCRNNILTVILFIFIWTRQSASRIF